MGHCVSGDGMEERRGEGGREGREGRVRERVKRKLDYDLSPILPCHSSLLLTMVSSMG